MRAINADYFISFVERLAKNESPEKA